MGPEAKERVLEIGRREIERISKNMRSVKRNTILIPYRRKDKPEYFGADEVNIDEALAIFEA